VTFARQEVTNLVGDLVGRTTVTTPKELPRNSQVCH
jgi:hypothetical protein